MIRQPPGAKPTYTLCPYTTLFLSLNPDAPELRVRATYGTYDQADLVVTASGPVSDLIRVGGSVARLSRGGFGDNLNIAGLENYNKDVWAGRATVEMGGNGAPVFIRLSGDFPRDKSYPRTGPRLIPCLHSGAPVFDHLYSLRPGSHHPKSDVTDLCQDMIFAAAAARTPHLP